jgi:protein-disulfide isomerase
VTVGVLAQRYFSRVPPSRFSYHRRQERRIQTDMTNHYLVLALAFLLITSLASAQTVDPALRPPKGAQVALVVFEDLQCPDCRRAAPLVEEAARTYKIPVVRHDFPLPMHNWSYDAALIARYFDTRSKQLGNDFRDYIFQHQPEITPPTLRAFAEKFAADHKVDLPFAVDPQGKLAEGINQDKNLGQRVGINHTPTIYVVSNKTQGKPFVEVVDRTKLFQLIDVMKNE